MKLSWILMLVTACVLPAARAAEKSSPDQRLAALGLVLPAVPAAVANYTPAVRSGNLVFLAGQIPRGSDGKYLKGKVGHDFTEAQATAAARTCTLQLLAALKAEIGDLGRVKRIVRVGGFVNCTADFTAHPQVINGASDLLVAVFGESGRHARASVGVSSLPAGAPVEIELTAEVME